MSLSRIVYWSIILSLLLDPLRFDSIVLNMFDCYIGTVSSQLQSLEILISSTVVASTTISANIKSPPHFQYEMSFATATLVSR